MQSRLLAPNAVLLNIQENTWEREHWYLKWHPTVWKFISILWINTVNVCWDTTPFSFCVINTLSKFNVYIDTCKHMHAYIYITSTKCRNVLLCYNQMPYSLLLYICCVHISCTLLYSLGLWLYLKVLWDLVFRINSISRWRPVVFHTEIN